MLKIFSISFLAILFLLSGFAPVIFAHGGEADGHSGTTMKMDDMMHIMMGRMASGCLTDEQQKAVALKLTAVAPQKTNQTLPLVTGIVIGLIVGLVGMSFFRKS